jgi:beta-1,4-N-acetylglucosaminyltransferase
MKLCLVCSHGGHLTELLELQPVWDEHDIFYITYHSARRMPSRAYRFRNLADGKLRVIPMYFQVLRILWRERPDWVVSDGAEIAIPVFFAAKLLRIDTLFIESLCRVHTPSFTGRVLYPISDVFLVQWPSLLEHYGPKARYEGGVI